MYGPLCNDFGQNLVSWVWTTKCHFGKKIINDREPCEYFKKSNTVIFCQQIKLSKFYRNNNYAIDILLNFLTFTMRLKFA